MANYHDIRYNFAIPTEADVGALTHIKTLTADASTATLSFVNGSADVVLDNTYRTYVFKLINCHAQNNGDITYFNFSDDFRYPLIKKEFK